MHGHIWSLVISLNLRLTPSYRALKETGELNHEICRRILWGINSWLVGVQDLADKIAQLNSAIDDVSSQLRAQDREQEQVEVMPSA